MKVRELLRSHRYVEAIASLRRDLANDPDDMTTVEGMADALRANGDYEEALSFFERLSAHSQRDNIANVLAPGADAWQIDIACLRWILGDCAKAIHLMHGLAAGILDGSMRYGDAAGGMSQGLLLYYMAISADVPEEASFALDYLRNQLESSFGVWPSPVAQHYLGDVPFEAVLQATNRRRTMPRMLDTAAIELGNRRRLVVALFHGGIKSRAQGDEERCLDHMRECHRLENPLIEQEWYLARYEVEKMERHRKLV